MPEAEDVLLDAAEWATSSARALWRRHRPAVPPAGAVLEDCQQVIALFLKACFAADWPILPSDPSLRPGWLARWIGKPPPWQLAPKQTAFTDGAEIFLPRRLTVFADEEADQRLLRLMALSLGARLSAGSIAACPTAALARDLFWAADGARIDAWLAEELPGLGREIAAARRLAIAERPPLEALTAAERGVEGIVRETLMGSTSLHRSARDASAWAVETAREPRFAGAYRGMAPVLHWGSPRPDLVAAAGRTGARSAPGDPARQKIRSHRLRQRVEIREGEEVEDDRPGPFFVPFGDPPQTIQDPAGLRRPEDNDEEMDLATLAEEMERLGRLPRMRSQTAVREALEAESNPRRHAARTPTDASFGAGGVRYPEWDHRTASYRPAHSIVRETSAPAGPLSWSRRALEEHRSLLAILRRRFERMRPRRVRQPRQRDGDDLDVDAFVEDFADRCAGRTPSDRLYLAERPLRRDVAVAFLVDASGSTDAWVGGGRTVLEVEKQATVVFCEALEALGDRYAIHAFSGRGAHDVRVARVKTFDEHYGDDARRRIAGLSAGAYTRLGAPIRHVTAMLTRERSRVRLLFILSDGKPNDEDEYEGRYGIEDTRQAVAEARLQGLSVFCLTVDREGSAYLPHMFGPRGYTVAADVSDLPARLPEIYRVLTERHM